VNTSEQFDQINAAVASGDLGRAAALSRDALRAGVKNALLMRLVAEDIERQGEPIKAVEYLQRALVLMPGDPMLLTALGGRYANLNQPSDAIRMFAAAIAADPQSAEAHYGMGGNLAGNGEVDAGRKHFERALEIDPPYADARAALALLMGRTGDSDGARIEAERALADAPGHHTATIAMAQTDIYRRDFVEAEARLRPLLEETDINPHATATAYGLLADALDGQGRPVEAFAAYTRANDGFRELFAKRFASASNALHTRIDRLIATFGRETPERWKDAPPTGPGEQSGARGHAFLVGFPRSGTTLLEQVLAAHPDVVTLEERPTLAKGEVEFMIKPGGVDRLAALTSQEAADYRRAYWRAVREMGVEVKDKVFIDKMPLSSLSLPLISKLFPQAKILFARRDPRDVVLSCYRRFFLPNPATYSMLSLKGAAEFYARVMRLADRYRAVLPPVLHEVRYERFIADFEGEARAFCAFLGLAWDEGMNAFAAKAATRLVTTPSAIQVRRGLYREGEGQWRPYRDEIAAVLPILEPWIEPQGYPAA
jgi:tetratricopeptide (TPR) repeat protein